MVGIFNIGGLDEQEIKSKIETNFDVLKEDFDRNGMKSGRFLGLYYIMKAAERGDITSQIALGNLYESGTIVQKDCEEAEKWYGRAVAQDHPKADGTMLAAGASAGLRRLGKG